MVFDPGNFTDPNYEDLQSRAYRDGMRISSNSWGADSNGATTSDAQRYDALVRDAQPAGSAVPDAGNQEMVIVFAAGNAGSGATRWARRHREEHHHARAPRRTCRPSAPRTSATTADDEGEQRHRTWRSSPAAGPPRTGARSRTSMAPGTHVSGGVAQAAAQRANPPAAATARRSRASTRSGVCAGPARATSARWASSGTRPPPAPGTPPPPSPAARRWCASTSSTRAWRRRARR